MSIYIQNIYGTKNISLNSRRSAESDEVKSVQKKFQEPSEIGKIREMFFFLRWRFHLMRQAKLKVRATSFKMVDNDPQRMRRRFLNHSAVFRSH